MMGNDKKTGMGRLDDGKISLSLPQMMKKLLTTLLLLVFLVGVIGLDIRAHYCGDELSALVVNGLPLHSPGDDAMPGCGEGDSCPHCKNIHQLYKISNNYHKATTLQLQPTLSLADWFHGDLPSALLGSWLQPLTAVAVCDDTPQGPPPGLLRPTVSPSCGWRAPPMA
jgi:hypothetical protein